MRMRTSFNFSVVLTIVFFAFPVLSVTGVFSAYAVAQGTSEVRTLPFEELAQTTGFLMAQQDSLERISREFPHMVSDVEEVSLQFSSSFGKASSLISDELRTILRDEYDHFVEKLQERIRNDGRKVSISPALAASFLTEVRLRARGQLPSPVLETLLTYEYSTSPVEEFQRRYIRSFQTTGHPKADGLDFKVSYPASWRAAEGERPHVVQKFTSRNGHGFEMLIIMVRDMGLPEGYEPTEEELKEVFSESQLKLSAPDNAKVISARPITLENRPAGVLLFDQSGERLDAHVDMRTQMYATVVKGHMVFLQFSVTLDGETNDSLSNRFEKFEPLFRQIANSLVLTGEY